MSERKIFTKADLAAAWRNSGGSLNYGEPTGTARCPYRYCRISSLMQANRYGNQYASDWVVDHKKALANGGTDESWNYQAMHNQCNAEKGNSE